MSTSDATADNQVVGVLLIAAVTPDSPAAAGGLLVGDIILELDANPIESPEDLFDLLWGTGLDLRYGSTCFGAASRHRYPLPWENVQRIDEGRPRRSAGHARSFADADERIRDHRREFASVGSAQAARLDADAFVMAAGKSDDEEILEALTSREIQVLELLAEGRSNKAIGQRLGISDRTVKFHVAAISGKARRRESHRRGPSSDSARDRVGLS